MVNHYAWWQAALAGDMQPIHESDPGAGFFRKKLKDGSMVGVAIWYQEDEPKALVDHRRAEPSEAWVSGAKRPVSEAAYREWEATGVWPDEHAIPKAPGSNEPQDDAEMLGDQIDSACAGVDDYAQITDNAQSAKAQSLRSRLLELHREVDNRRKRLKEPHLEAGRVIDAKWTPLAKAAKEGADLIARAMSKWETAKARAAYEAQRKVDEERRRQEAESLSAEEKSAPPFELEPSTPAPTTSIKGGYGRAASVKVVWSAQVDDYDAVYNFFRDRPEVKALLQKLAQQTVDLGHRLPGVTAIEERKVS